MRKLSLIFFIFLLAGVSLALLFHGDNGYLLLSYRGWRLETSLFFAVFFLLALFWAVVTFWRLLVAGVLFPRTLAGWREKRRKKRARRSLDTGLNRLHEGRWQQAETELLRLVGEHESPHVVYLAAARAAQRLGAVDRRNRYLDKAAAQRGASEMAVLLTQAELQMEAGQDAEALASLLRLREIDAEHSHVLRLLVDLCERTRDWPHMRDILPAAARAGVLDTGRWVRLSTLAWSHALAEAGTDEESLEATWRRVPKRMRREADMVKAYAEALQRAGADDKAAKKIEKTLGSRWEPALALLYGDLSTDDRTAQLAAVEGWLKQYGDEPELMLVAGRLCLRNRLWGRARSYFESSLKGQSRPEALLELGRLFEEIEENSDASAAYRQGLEQALAPTRPPA